MLVLTRKVGTAILIGDDIVVRVLHSDHGTVKLGIVAPKHMNVIRDDLKIKLESQGIEVKGTKE